MAHGIGIIGLGIMGERMLRYVRRHPDFRVPAAWDPADESAAKLMALAPETRFARDAADLAGDPAIDCVYVATPPATHLAYADLAFDRGKALFCEKPLAVDLAAARARGRARRARAAGGGDQLSPRLGAGGQRDRRGAALGRARPASSASRSRSPSPAGRGRGRRPRAGSRGAAKAASCARCCRISCS